jgi:patatin-like phospholipase/acyl hydrolase
MTYKVRTGEEHFLKDGNPKRILALDGGGLRGIVTLSFLAELESMLKERHGGTAAFRLSHYFDLIAGTSTGAIIAAALAQGMTVAEITRNISRSAVPSFKRASFVREFSGHSMMRPDLLPS